MHSSQFYTFRYVFILHQSCLASHQLLSPNKAYRLLLVQIDTCISSHPSSTAYHLVLAAPRPRKSDPSNSISPGPPRSAPRRSDKFKLRRKQCIRSKQTAPHTCRPQRVRDSVFTLQSSARSVEVSCIVHRGLNIPARFRESRA